MSNRDLDTGLLIIPEELRAILERLDASVEERLKLHEGTRRPDLYHYAPADAFIGIVETRTLWATDVLHMNDSLELAWGTKLVKEICNKLIDTLSYATIPQIYEPAPGRIFAACFTERADSLPQWRGYADDGLGYAVGLILENMPRPPRSVCRLVKIVYDEKLQRELVTQAFVQGGAAVKWIDDQKFDEEHELDLLRLVKVRVSSALSRLVSLFKNPAFEYEQEWRYVVEPLFTEDKPAHDGVSFRRSRFGVTPYFKLVFEPLLPLAEVVLGPRTPEALAERAVVALLLANKHLIQRTPRHAGVHIWRSEASYR